jgi:hypothetical protein
MCLSMKLVATFVFQKVLTQGRLKGTTDTDFVFSGVKTFCVCHVVSPESQHLHSCIGIVSWRMNGTYLILSRRTFHSKAISYSKE